MLTKLFQLISLCLFCVNCLAQTSKFTGTVRSAGNILSSASIQLKTYNEQQLLFYGLSDDKGNYIISGELGTSSRFILIASYIGFKQDTLIIERKDVVKNPIIVHDFHLIEDVRQLDEIYIKTPPPISVNNDTTIYNVSKFISPQDRNIEAVIKKMPGMEVDKDGAIFFKGKRVGSVLLDGDDLTGKGYKSVTRNLKPEFVEEVQALENYVEDNLLKGIINSDDVALNLKLKNDKAKKILGSIDGALGTSNRRSLSANLISIVQRTKAFTLLNHGNLPDQITNISDVSEENRSFVGDNRMIKQYIGTYNPFDGSLHTITNLSHASLNAITRIGDNLKINYSFHYLWNRLYGETSVQNTYFQSSPIITVDHDNRYSLAKTLKANINIDYLADKRSRISTKFNYMQRPEYYSNTSFSAFNDLNGDSVLQSRNDQSKDFNGYFKYTLKSDQRTAYLFSARVSKGMVDQDYSVSSALYKNIPIFRGSQDLLQEVDNNFLRMKIDIEALKRYRSNFLYLNLGTDARHLQLNSDLYIEDQTKWLSLGEDFRNGKMFKLYRGYAMGKYVFDNQPFKLLAQLKSNLLYVRNSGRDTVRIVLEPTLSFSYRLSQIQSISLNYNYTNTNPEPIEYYEKFILTNLRNFNVGLNHFYSYNTHALGIKYNFNDLTTSYLTANISLDGTVSRYGFLYSNTFTERLNYIKKQPYKGVRSMYSNINIKKFSPTLSLTLTGNYMPSFATYYAYVGDKIEEFSSFGQSMMLKINTGFNIPINFGIATALQTTTVRTSRNLVTQNTARNYTLEYVYKISDKIINISSMDLYRVNGSRFSLVDTEIQFSPVKGVFKYNLKGKNLTNIKSFTAVDITEAYSSVSSSSILGRYLLLGITMSVK